MQISDIQQWHSTSLFLPAWWARAYDVAVQNDSGDFSAMDVAVRSGVAPAMDLVELNAVAMLLQNFQTQILKNGVKVLSISSREHQKHAGTNTRSRRFVFEKAAQMLGDIRLLRRSEEGGEQEIRFSRLFSGETWEHSGQHFLIKMTPARLGPELIFGVSDPHMDLARAFAGDPEGRSVTGDTAPLSLLRSAWLDLQGIEQGVYLRMEMAMQWFRNLLQIDGIWGCSVQELFGGFRLPTPRAAKNVSETEKILRLLEKLGKKLEQHGVMSLIDDDQYLAFDMQNDGGTDPAATIVWQVSRDRHHDGPRHAYLKQVAHWMEADRARDFVPRIARICLPRTVNAERMRDAEALWEGICKADVARQYFPGMENAAAQPVLPSLLFFELCLRASRRDELSIPESCFAGALQTIVTGVTPDSAGEAFARFSQFLADSYDFTNALKSVPFVSLASRITRESVDFKKNLRELAKPAPSESVILNVPQAEPAAATEFSVNQIRIASGDTEARKKPGISDAAVSRMLRTASDELVRMRDSHPDRYLRLKKSYLASLDETGRKLFLDFQRRMQPSIFEDHIKQKLIRYMVDHPSGWGS